MSEDPTPTTPRRFKPGPFDYHQEIELEIDTLTNLGQGLGRMDDWVIFVPFALPGERVRARVFRNHKQHSEADLIEVLQASPDRIEPECPLFGTCGGCQYQNLSYEAQLRWKRQQVQELLSHMADLEAEVLAPIPSPNLFTYRSKITPHFKKPRNGEVGAIGFLKNGRRSELIDVSRCLIATEGINEALPQVRADARANAPMFKKGVTLLLRESADDTICTDATEVCEEQVGNLRFQFHAGEFFQNNPSILPAFTEHVAQEASQEGARYLVDAYCGSGLFALSSANRFQAVSGVEISESSIDWARRNAKANGIEHVQFLQGDAQAIFAEIDYPSAESAVIIDPPRKGSNPAFLDQLLEFAPATIVYVSCNPATQMRDLQSLKREYSVSKVQPFDLFPHTKHLECVITLQRTPPAEDQA